MIRYLMLSMLVVLFFSCRSQSTETLPVNADNNTLLWEISGNNVQKPSYLYGTFHVLCKEDIQFSANLKKAVQQSNNVYFEIDLDEPENVLGMLMFVNMNNGVKLKDLYSEDEYQRLKNFFKDSLSTNLTMIEKMKPFFLEAMVYPKLLACNRMSGVEEELLTMAKAGKKEIRGFETIMFQASVFDSIPYKDQAKELLEMVDSIRDYSVYFQKMVDAYKKQDLTGIESAFSDPHYNMDEKNEEIMLGSRNRNWVQQLKKILPADNIFMAVGAGHLIGKNGLIALLRKEGYTVKPIVNR